ncbi:MAG: site-specific DNA-methyltransferase [Nitrospinae bacterium]|nr:site-specific DNA-methyltransferase [Nitrospinota bacterium]
MNNHLIYGDNHDVLVSLESNNEIHGKVRLVYIDPPYGTKQDFTFSGDRFATISRVNGGKVAYQDTLTGEDYLKFLSGRLIRIREIMADDGVIYLHIDSKTGHYVKVLMDKIFGQNNFINDITRIKCNPKNFSRKGFGNIKDMVLLYSKSNNYLWNDARQKIEIGDNDRRFRSTDKDGRKYTTTPLHAPGETTNGATGKRWKGKLPPAGRHWRYAPSTLDDLNERGVIEWSSTGNPRKKIYAEDVMKSGVKLQDVWVYKDPQNPTYPTEKNLDMLKMIISTSSNVGDVVLDAFCGSGSTLFAAQELRRSWIGIDSSKQAIAICKKRLSNFEYSEIRDRKERHESLVIQHFKLSYV